MQTLDEKGRREQKLVKDAPVHITSQFYGPNLYNHDGTIVAVDQRLPYPYAVKVHGVEGCGDAIRDFAWYEIETRS